MPHRRRLDNGPKSLMTCIQVELKAAGNDSRHEIGKGQCVRGLRVDRRGEVGESGQNKEAPFVLTAYPPTSTYFPLMTIS